MQIEFNIRCFESFRGYLGLDQETFGLLLGISRTAYNLIVNGKSNPSGQVIVNFFFMCLYVYGTKCFEMFKDPFIVHDTDFALLEAFKVSC